MDKDMLVIYMQPTRIIDSNHVIVQNVAHDVVGNIVDDVERAVRLYLWVRDRIRYNPYAPFYLEEHYRASWVIQRGESFCIPKASVLCALCRALKIPARIGFADVKNHLATRKFLERLGTDLVIYHGYVEMFIRNRWVKASPAFDYETCRRFGVPPLDFNGIDDALLQAYAPPIEEPEAGVTSYSRRRFMEYVKYHGTREDVPIGEILSMWEKVYGRERVRSWIDEIEKKVHGEGLMKCSKACSKDMFWTDVLDVSLGEANLELAQQEAVKVAKAFLKDDNPMILAWYDRSKDRSSPNVECCSDNMPGWLVYAKSRGGRLIVSVNSEEYVFVFL